MSTVFLFGAGASHGSDNDGVPPLADELFDKLAEYDPSGWGTITGMRANEFRRDFEKGFETLDRHVYAPRLIVMGRYFFQFKRGAR